MPRYFQCPKCDSRLNEDYGKRADRQCDTCYLEGCMWCFQDRTECNECHDKWMREN